MACDAACRVLDGTGAVVDGVYAAGDVARWEHPCFPGEPVSLEHWGNAVDQAETAAHNMLHTARDHRAGRAMPAFWSDQFGLNIKSVGLPALADHVALTQGSFESGRFVAAYGRRGRIVGAVAVNMPRVLDAYAALTEARTSFPPVLNAPDGPADVVPLPAGFPASAGLGHGTDARDGTAAAPLAA